MATDLTKPAGSVKEFSNFLAMLKNQVALALPKHMGADRMARLALTAFSTNRKLQACSLQSIAASIMVASQLGLEIGVGGQGWLIPYKNMATFVPGWKGLIDLLSRSGKAAAWTGAVFEGDEFEWALGDSPFVTHRPQGEEDKSKLKYVYAIGRINGNAHPIVEVWPIQKVEKHRDKYNKVGLDHYSFQHLEMYARKVVLLQVLKYLPQSVEMAAAIALNDAAEIGERVTLDAEFVVTGLDGEEQSTPRESLKDKLRSTATQKPNETPQPTVPVGQTDMPAVTADQIMEMINKSATVDDLNICRDLARGVMDKSDQARIQSALRERAMNKELQND